jgi:hypothetical protein
MSFFALLFAALLAGATHFGMHAHDVSGGGPTSAGVNYVSGGGPTSVTVNDVGGGGPSGAVNYVYGGGPTE